MTKWIVSASAKAMWLKETEQSQPAVLHRGYAGHPVWSPDGGLLAFDIAFDAETPKDVVVDKEGTHFEPKKWLPWRNQSCCTGWA